jgi:hypothetical protein
MTAMHKNFEVHKNRGQGRRERRAARGIWIQEIVDAEY